jgi:queuine/archaeosine tRNA-ribosyltransferase
MTVQRKHTLGLAGTTVQLPCFFPSVSSVKTNLLPVDYVELLAASAYPLFLVSAYDIASSAPEHQERIDRATKQSRSEGSVVLLDSGNYESFWKGAPDWRAETFHKISSTYEYDIGFCFDNQVPPTTAKAISEDVVRGVLRDQERSSSTIVPIVHGPTDLLPEAAQMVAGQLYPVLLAVPERALGDGILARARSVRKIRQALDQLGFYCPLHLLGTGNPISIIAYSIAGADSFDGLEWCQTVVDHETAFLFHFQHWDFVRGQTDWGSHGTLPYIQSALMHNLDFYASFMRKLQESIGCCNPHGIMKAFLPGTRGEIILNSLEGV